MKSVLTQGAILCVEGDLKWTFNTPTVTTMDNVTSIWCSSGLQEVRSKKNEKSVRRKRNKMVHHHQ